MNTHEICLINIYERYNFSLINDNEILLKESVFALKQILHMMNKNVIVSDFNLHYFH